MSYSKYGRAERVRGFIKYTRTQCLSTHLISYYNKITEVAHNEKHAFISRQFEYSSLS